MTDIESRTSTKLNGRRARLEFLLLFGALVWCSLIFAPVLLTGGPKAARAAAWIRIFFSPICHQIRERTFTVRGIPLSVCARCTGIYLGFSAGAGAALFLKTPFAGGPIWKRLLLAALGLAALELILSGLRLIPSSMILRALTGAPLGGIAAFLTVSAVAELTILLKSKDRPCKNLPEN